MDKNNALSMDFKLLPYLSTRNGIVEEVGYSFLDLTGYPKYSFLGRSISEVFTQLLRIKCIIENLGNADRHKIFFLFTSSLKVRQVKIETISGINETEKVYIFNEKPSSRLEEKCAFVEKIFLDNQLGVGIYSVPDSILLMANEKYVSYIDEPFNQLENVLGLSREEFVKDWKGSSGEKSWQNMCEAGESIYAEESAKLMSDGSNRYWNNMVTPVMEEGKIRYIISILEEVTDKVVYRQQLEDRYCIIRRQKEELEAVIENMTEGLSIVDRDGNYTYTNKVIRSYHAGYESIDKIGSTYEAGKYLDIDGNEILTEDLPTYRIIKGEKLRDFRILMKNSDDCRYFSINGTPIFDNEGNFRLGVICTRDITEQVKYDLSMREKQDLRFQEEKREKEDLQKVLRMKNEFFSFISHEFKMPLTVINAAIQAMESICKDELSEKAKKYISSIRRNCFRQMRLVNNLLDITRGNEGRLKLDMSNIDIVNLTKSITDSVSIYARQKGVEITFTSLMPKKIIALDEEKYERILLNLLSNAIKFTPAGKQVKVRILVKNRKTCIEVEDEGLGIPKDKLKLIFERFGQVDSSLTRRAEGTGIGLTLVKLLVQAMKGDILVDSEIGVGSVFSVYLPISKVIESKENNDLEEIIDRRLTQAIAIEFSDIYLSE